MGLAAASTEHLAERDATTPSFRKRGMERGIAQRGGRKGGNKEPHVKRSEFTPSGFREGKQTKINYKYNIDHTKQPGLLAAALPMRMCHHIMKKPYRLSRWRCAAAPWLPATRGGRSPSCRTRRCSRCPGLIAPTLRPPGPPPRRSPPCLG